MLKIFDNLPLCHLFLVLCLFLVTDLLQSASDTGAEIIEKAYEFNTHALAINIVLP